jgi:hypothetical protein
MFTNRSCHFWRFQLLLTRHLHPSPGETEVASAIIMITRFQGSVSNILDYSTFNKRETVMEVNKVKYSHFERSPYTEMNKDGRVSD